MDVDGVIRLVGLVVGVIAEAVFAVDEGVGETEGSVCEKTIPIGVWELL